MSEKKYYKLEYDEENGLRAGCNMPFDEIISIFVHAITTDIAAGVVNHGIPSGDLVGLVKFAFNSDEFDELVKEKILEKDPDFDFEKEAREQISVLLKSISEELENGN